MESLTLGPIPYHENLTFVWLAAGTHGELEAAFAIDGRNYSDADVARAAVRDALEQTDLRTCVGDFRSVGITSANLRELDYWPNWAEFQTFLDVYGPVYPWRRPSRPSSPFRTRPQSRPHSPQSESPRSLAQAPPEVQAQAVAGSVEFVAGPLYSGRHFECWGQLVETFAPNRGPEDPVLGRRAHGYGLNGYTGEFEADTRRAVQCANGLEDDDTWPFRDEDEFIEAVEDRREALLRRSFYQRHDKPEIFAAYERGAGAGRTAQSRRATYEMWRSVQRRRAYFLVDAEPVRVDLAEDGSPVMARRLDEATGRIVCTTLVDAQSVVGGGGGGGGTRVTEHVWLLAVEERRRGLETDGAIASAYGRAAALSDDVYRRLILTRSFDLWAEKFAGGEGSGS